MLSYLTTGASKIATSAVQLLALPVISRSLGSDRFGALLLLGAISAFCLIPAAGLSPTASFGLARSRAGDDIEAERSEFWAVTLIGLIIGGCGLLGFSLVALLVDPSRILGPGAQAFHGEATAGIFMVGLFVFFHATSWWAEGARAAYQQNYITNIYGAVSSALVVVLTLTFRFFSATVYAFYFAIYVTPMAVQAINLISLYLERRSTYRTPKSSRAALRSIGSRAFSYNVGQIGLAMQLQGSVFLIGRMVGLSEGAVIGGLVRVFYIIHSMLISFVQPFVPTINIGVVRGDKVWVRRTVTGMVALILLATASVGVGTALFGHLVLFRWLHISTQHGWVYFALAGAFACLYMSGQTIFLILISLGHVAWAGRRLLLAGLLGVALSLISLPEFGATAVLLSHCVALLLIVGVAFPLRAIRDAARGAHAEPVAPEVVEAMEA